MRTPVTCASLGGPRVLRVRRSTLWLLYQVHSSAQAASFIREVSHGPIDGEATRRQHSRRERRLSTQRARRASRGVTVGQRTPRAALGGGRGRARRRKGKNQDPVLPP